MNTGLPGPDRRRIGVLLPTGHHVGQMVNIFRHSHLLAASITEEFSALILSHNTSLPR